MTTPVLRLRPNIEFRDTLWVYDNQLVLDRRTRNIPAGSVVTLQDAGREDVAVGVFNPVSKIAFRYLGPVGTVIDRDWIKNRLRKALALREDLFDAPYYRLVHAEADGFPGVIIDRFGDNFVIQPNAAWAEILLDDFVAALKDVANAKTIIKNGTGRSRKLEGLDEETGLLAGELSGAIPVPMNGAIYMADVIEGQKTGLFFDQRLNHAFAAGLGKEKSVLDVFSHVGGFGLAALAKGAREAICVDGSEPALKLAEEGAAQMGVSDRFSTIKGDAFKVMEDLQTQGQSYGLVVCDPPAFAPSKQALSNGLRAYEKTARMGASLVEPGGYFVMCSCSHAADLSKFRNAVLRGIKRAGRKAQLLQSGGAGPDHPVHPELAESSYLKALFFRIE